LNITTNQQIDAVSELPHNNQLENLVDNNNNYPEESKSILYDINQLQHPSSAKPTPRKKQGTPK
jgi:hypothetical protein